MIGTYDQPKPKLEPTESPIISGQIYLLNSLTEKLRKAYHGQDVEIVDDTEETFDGSGSGSGDGTDEEDAKETAEEEDTFRINRVDESFASSPPLSSTLAPEVVRTSSANTNSMSLARALIQYLLPMVMVWFGGTIKDLL